jgi:ribosomal protein S6--L-glutamate ligase
VPALRDLAAPGAAWPGPVVVKSRTSSRSDLVRLVPDRAQLAELLPTWGDEPVVAQEFAASDGFDIKVWVIGEALSAARRRSALEVVDKTADEMLDPDAMPEVWRRVARDAGAALGLQLYGVDLLVTDDGPVVVDVNPFPGFRGAREPAAALLDFLAGIAATRTATGAVTA